MRRITLVAVLTVIVGGLVVTLGVSPAEARRGAGIEWQYHEEGGGYYRDPEEPGPGQGRPVPDDEGWYYTTLVGYQKYFSENYQDAGNRLDCVGNPQFENCQNTFYGCVGLWYEGTDEGRPAHPYQQFRQHVDWTDDGEFDPNGRLEDMGEPGEVNCVRVGDDDWVSQEDLWEVNYEVFQALGEPKIEFAPAVRTLVQLPTIVSTEYPTPADLAGGNAILTGEEPVTIEIPIVVPKPGQDFEGVITAKARFEWTFEGAGTSAPDRGRPYEQGKTPFNSPGYYITAVFTTVDATTTVEVQVTWTGDVEVPGIDVNEPILPVEMPPASDTITVVEKTNVHSGN